MAGRVLWNVEHLNLEIGRQTLFRDAAMSVQDGERVALVGRNGCGKSTLLKIIAGEEQPSTGDISVARGIRIAYMPQTFEPPAGLTVEQAVREGLAYFDSLLKRYESLPPDSPEHDALEHQLTWHDAWLPEKKLEITLAKLAVPDPSRPCASLSGGLSF